MKYLLTRQQRSNCVEALKMLDGLREEDIAPGFEFWRDDDPAKVRGIALEPGAPRCGTVACIGGWLAWWPEFRKQGVFATRHGSPTIHRKWSTSQMTTAETSDQLFGVDWIFLSRDECPPDDELPIGASDLECAKHRFNWLLDNSTVGVRE